MRYRTETRTDSEGNSYTVEVPYQLLHLKCDPHQQTYIFRGL